MRHKLQLSEEEWKIILDTDLDVQVAVIGYMLCRHGYSIEDFKDGWIFDPAKHVLEFGIETDHEN